MSGTGNNNTSPAPSKRVPSYHGNPGKTALPQKKVTVKETTMPGQKKGS